VAGVCATQAAAAELKSTWSAFEGNIAAAAAAEANGLMGVIDSASSTASAVRLLKMVRRSTDSSCSYSMSICGEMTAD
jgi:hypothetical protein